jgi:hypothetical protein
MVRSGMRERRNLISARCIKNKYFRWILNLSVEFFFFETATFSTTATQQMQNHRFKDQNEG